ncbi:MAG TPA: copper amine oxidase N-terminal domain-containing protein [Fimbriimonadaceae bacterium]|nr:copper amine oxidase N-terminal domain-containing protein [Fimbriimonadaceae bacterium]
MRQMFKVVPVLTAAACAAVAYGQIQVRVDGTDVNFPNAQAQYIDGRVLVPLRGVFQQLGAQVNWDRYTQTITATKGDRRVRLTIGKRTATIDGSPVQVDVPPMIMQGTTMVPIRFVSEALGAQVRWDDAQQLVSINTMDSQSAVITSPRHYLRRATLTMGEVIPVVLDRTLSSDNSRVGETFMASIEDNGQAGYDGLPRGAKIEGHVAACRPRRGSEPGILDLSFDRIQFPDGRTQRIDGSLISLNDRYTSKCENGIIVARERNGGNRMVYIGYGNGSGMLVNVQTNQPVTGPVYRSEYNYIVGQVNPDRRQAWNITLPSGTELGIRLDRNLRASW